MNISKNNLLFFVSGGIIVLCLILSLVLIGTKGKLSFNKQTKNQKQTKQTDNQTADTGQDNQASTDKTKSEYKIPPVKKLDFSNISTTAKDKIASLSLEDKIAQLFLVSPDSLTGVNNATIAGNTTKKALTAYTVGGLIYNSGNLNDEIQTKTMLENTNSFSKEKINLPLFLAVKENADDNSPISNNPAFPMPKTHSPQELAKLSTKDAFNTGNKIGKYLSGLGFNMNLAPCAVLSEDSLGLGTDSNEVSNKALAFYSALQSQNILGVYTDFPGKGAYTEGENGILSNTEDISTLKTKHLIPYQKGLENSSIIMLNDMAYPKITSSIAPAFISNKMVRDFIRNELNYKGLIITPLLNSKRLTDMFSESEMAVLAIEAGCDMIYEPQNFHQAYEAVLNAVETNRISEERINESLARILTIKEKLS